jgi:hypothetical protein
MNMLCIGNNPLNQKQERADIAGSIEQGLQNGTLVRSAIEKAAGRVR